MDRLNVHSKLTFIAVITLAVAGIVVSWLSSYRIGWVDMSFGWHASFDRTASAVAVGIAFASTASTSIALSDFRNHVIGFAAITIASSTILLGILLDWWWGVNVIASLIGAVAMIYFSKYTLHQQNRNVWATLILSVAIFLCVFNFIAAASVAGDIGKIVFWSQGDLLQAGSYSSLGLLLSVTLFVWLLKSDSKEVPAALLFGLGIGMAGPLFFVGCLIPQLVRKCLGADRGALYLVASAATGALLVVLVDSIPRLLLGGYSPTLIIPIAVVSIPLLLCFERSKALSTFPNNRRAAVEAILIGLWVVGFIVLFFHIIDFASRAT